MRNINRQMFVSSPGFWWPVLALLLTLLLLVGLYVAAPWPHWVRVANVGSRSLSVGWVTEKETSGCVIVQMGTSFLAKGRTICSYEIGRTHLVTVDGLDENTTYAVMVKQGWRVYPSTRKQVTTYLAKVNMPVQVPGYGVVVDEQGNRVARALVYVYPAGGGNQYPEATMANSQGNYALDLGFFGPIEEWVVEGGSGPWQWNAMIMSGKVTTPFPPLEVEYHE